MSLDDVKKDLAVIDAPLTSSAMAEFANYDVTQFEGIKLDVNENKELFSNDILIPKVWLVQAMSDLRKQKKADEGQFVDSQTSEVLANIGGTLQFIVLKTFKRWHTFEMVGDKKEFISSEIMVLGKNHDLPYEETVEGKKIVRRQVISAYILLEKDAIHGVNKPYVIDFAASSKFGGRKMISDIKALNNRNLPCFVGFFKMTSEEEKFDKGEAFVKNVQFGGFVPKTAVPFLVECRKELDAIEDQIEIDDRDVISTTSEEAQTDVTNQALASDNAGI